MPSVYDESQQINQQFTEQAQEIINQFLIMNSYKQIEDIYTFHRYGAVVEIGKLIGDLALDSSRNERRVRILLFQEILPKFINESLSSA